MHDQDEKHMQRVMIDRPLDPNHVKTVMSDAKKYRHLSLQGSNLLGLYHGTRKELKQATSRINAKIEKRKKGSIPPDLIQTVGKI